MRMKNQKIMECLESIRRFFCRTWYYLVQTSAECTVFKVISKSIHNHVLDSMLAVAKRKFIIILKLIIGATNFLILLLQYNLTDIFLKTLKINFNNANDNCGKSEHCFSTLRRVMIFLWDTVGIDCVNVLAIMSINKNLVQCTASFNGKMLEEFIYIISYRK